MRRNQGNIFFVISEYQEILELTFLFLLSRTEISSSSSSNFKITEKSVEISTLILSLKVFAREVTMERHWKKKKEENLIRRQITRKK